MVDRRKTTPDKEARRQQDRAGSSAVDTLPERQSDAEALAEFDAMEEQERRQVFDQEQEARASFGYGSRPRPLSPAAWDRAHPVAASVGLLPARQPSPPGMFERVVESVIPGNGPSGQVIPRLLGPLWGSPDYSVGEKVNRLLLTASTRAYGDTAAPRIAAVITALHASFRDEPDAQFAILTEGPGAYIPPPPTAEELADREADREEARLRRLERLRTEFALALTAESLATAKRERAAAALAELDPPAAEPAQTEQPEEDA